MLNNNTQKHLTDCKQIELFVWERNTWKSLNELSQLI